MSERKYKTFTKEFKLEAVRLLEEAGQPAAEIARELGIRRNQLYKWQQRIRAQGDKLFGGRGRREGPEDEVARLRREVAWLREERDILKKAAAYFATQSQQSTRLSDNTRSRFA